MFSHELKMDRATQHLEALEAEIGPWLEAHRPTVRTTLDSRSNIKLLWVDASVIQPPIHLGLIIGDCLHNLRSALDNLVYELSVTYNNGPLSEEVAHVPMFPIEKKREDFKKRKCRLKYIAPEVRDCIEGMQPFNHPHMSHERNHLWVLNELSNMDKHRVPHVALSVELKGLGVQDPTQDYEENLRMMPFKALNESLLLAEYPAAGNMNVFPLFGVAFGQEAPDGTQRWPVDTILRWLRDSLNDKVFPKLEKYLD